MLTKEMIEVLKEFQDLQMKTVSNIQSSDTYVLFFEISATNDWLTVRVDFFSRLTEENAVSADLSIYEFDSPEDIGRKLSKFRSDLKWKFGIVF